jgi:hypothetical protein
VYALQSGPGACHSPASNPAQQPAHSPATPLSACASLPCLLTGWTASSGVQLALWPLQMYPVCRAWRQQGPSRPRRLRLTRCNGRQPATGQVCWCGSLQGECTALRAAIVRGRALVCACMRPGRRRARRQAQQRAASGSHAHAVVTQHGSHAAAHVITGMHEWVYMCHSSKPLLTGNCAAPRLLVPKSLAYTSFSMYPDLHVGSS